MYANVKKVPSLVYAGIMIWTMCSTASAQSRVVIHRQFMLAPDEAREILNAGLKSYDESRFPDAETRFREVVRRFPKNVVADRADYYLIRTLVQLGRRPEALNRINSFATQYPRSKWQPDVEELRIQLTNQIPATMESAMAQMSAHFNYRAWPPAPLPKIQVQVSPVPAQPPSPPSPPPTPAPFGVFVLQNGDPELSLQQEILRALFHHNVDNAIEIASERLKVNPGDPVVLSSLNLVASTRSPQGSTMLLDIIKNSPNPRARRDAIFWLGQSSNDKGAVVDTLLGLIPSLNDDDSEAVAYSLSQVGTDKAVNALSTIARDKTKSDKARTSALFWISQSRTPNRVNLLEDIYKNSMDSSRIRDQILFALNQTHDPQAARVLGNAAATDPDMQVRRRAVFWLSETKTADSNQMLENLLQKK